ncbi:MAG: PAS domain-containing protein [Deltaproteobacteria bacterium]|nr:PAS domain-containing protein [Deltaproteobacteria bacterium]
MSFLLIAVVVFQAMVNYNREKKYMSKLLKEKGAALIRSFEAGAKIGMMGKLGNEANLQALLEETASQPDIAYIVLVGRDGIILAHNNKQMIGTRFNDSGHQKKISAIDKPQWRIVDRGGNLKYFEVYKTFLPILKNPGRFSNNKVMSKMGEQCDMPMWCSSGWMKGMPADLILSPENRPAIFIGMDIGPFEEAIKEDMHNSVIMVSVIFLLGMAGVVSLFWAQSFTRSRRLLQDTRAFASETMANLPMGIIVINENNAITYINDTACLFLEKNIHTVKEKNAKNIFPDELWELHKIVKNGGIVSENEIIMETVKNKTIPLSVTVTDVIGEEGNFIGFVFILRDLSDIRDLEIQVQRKEKLAALGTLAAGVAHEVRNPLSSIRGYATFFGNLFESDSENRKAAYVMAEEVDRVNRVISELLEFARPFDLKLKKTDIVQFINNSLRIIKHEAETANVTVIKKIDKSISSLKIDPDRFSQVLLNLYINAIQEMKSGGELTVKVGIKEEAMVFEVSDTGQGISPEDQASIFNPYFTTKKMGTGLGLAIVHKIVESHDGSIHITSLEGKGTTFAVFIPIAGK